MIIAHNAPHRNQEPHERIHQIAREFPIMAASDRRMVLQSLPLPDLCNLAHLLPTYHPRDSTADLAWSWIRMLMEPLAWDITLELDTDGPRYVAYWGGQRFLWKSALIDVRAANFYALSQDMDSFFATVYPKRLIDVGMEVVYAAT